MDYSTRLSDALSRVAPVTGVSVPDPSNKSTWRVVYHQSSTPEQRAAAQAILDAWTEADFDPTPEEALRRFAHSQLGEMVLAWAAIQCSYSELPPALQAKAGPLRTRLRDLIVAGLTDKINNLP